MQYMSSTQEKMETLFIYIFLSNFFLFNELQVFTFKVDTSKKILLENERERGGEGEKRVREKERE